MTSQKVSSVQNIYSWYTIALCLPKRTPPETKQKCSDNKKSEIPVDQTISILPVADLEIQEEFDKNGRNGRFRQS